MKLIMQGMRRSGTTIVYDVLCQDADLTCWYEPLAAAKKPAVGGGSGMQASDVFANLRLEREAFARDKGVDYDLLNYGAPRDPALEFEETLPSVVREYLLHLLQRPGPVMAKFTRMYRKVHELAALAEDALFVHLVRDPRAVAASYLFGKAQRNKRLFPTARAFFTRRSSYTAWSSGPFSELVLAQPGWERYVDPLDFERILLVWHFTFRETYERGRAAFGDRYMLLRHEDFCADPVASLQTLYRRAGRELPEAVQDWAGRHVRPVEQPYGVEDVRWKRAFNRLDMWPALRAAGYETD